VKIVTGKKEHLDGLKEVFVELMEHHRPIDHRFPMIDNAQTIYQKRLLNYMNTEDTQILVALEGDEVIGFATLRIDKYSPVFHPGTYGMIDDMAVKARYRRQGTGQKILEAAYTWFRSKKVDRVELSVLTQNETGYAFWKKQGYKDYLHCMYLSI